MKKHVFIPILFIILLCCFACQALEPNSYNSTTSDTVSFYKSGENDTSATPTYNNPDNDGFTSTNYFAVDGGVSPTWEPPKYSLYRLLTPSNFDGEYYPYDGEVSEILCDKLPEAKYIVQDDRGIKGTEITLSFSKYEPYVQFLLCIDENGTETLILATYDRCLFDTVLMLVCRSDFGSAENFYNTVFECRPFNVTVLEDINVSALHARHYFVRHPDAEAEQAYYINSAADVLRNPNETQYYAGYFGNPHDYKFGNYMYGNLLPAEEQDDDAAISRTVERTKLLLDMFGIDGYIE